MSSVENATKAVVSMTAPEKIHGGKYESRQTPDGLKRVAQLGLLAVVMIVALGARGCPEVPPLEDCFPLDVRVAPGTCAPISNPCLLHDEWFVDPKVDWFSFDPTTDQQIDLLTSAQLSITTTRSSTATSRLVCAGVNAPPLKETAFHFLYTFGSSNTGEDTRQMGGHMNITVASDFQVNVSATPATITNGGQSQLLASVSGGIPPYTYFWHGQDLHVNFQDPAAAIATPTETTTYTVEVLDSDFPISQKTASTTVTVVNSPLPTAGFTFNITCCPPSVQLDGNASTGNISSYAWDLSWTPANPDRTTTTPLSDFPFREVDRGTITLTVTDNLGRTATTTRRFP